MTLSKPPFKQLHSQEGVISRPWWSWYNGLWNEVNRGLNTVRITSTDSPYTVPFTVGVVMCDTDGGAITVNLYTARNKDYVSIYNVGSANNAVTINPAAGQTIRGESSQVLYDGENWDGRFQDTEYWR